jgi:hypothetical protein
MYSSVIYVIVKHVCKWKARTAIARYQYRGIKKLPCLIPYVQCNCYVVCMIRTHYDVTKLKHNIKQFNF